MTWDGDDDPNAHRDVRFALSILDECRNVGELANVMEGCIAGEFTSDEIAEKSLAFGSGIVRLTGAPVPCCASFCWGTA